MIESRDASKYLGWYVSAEGDPQGIALSNCAMEYIKESKSLLNLIIGEIELAETNEHSHEMILESIKTLVMQFPRIDSECRGFHWYIDWRD